jgi:hypothetical protein
MKAAIITCSVDGCGWGKKVHFGIYWANVAKVVKVG